METDEETKKNIKKIAFWVRFWSILSVVGLFFYGAFVLLIFLFLGTASL